MKGFIRDDQLFSLCGLNCGLCPMNVDGHCPGCGGGAGNQSCAIARCSISRGGVEYCFECAEYPCERYQGIDEYDSFITHRNQLGDMDRARRIGMDEYRAEQREKAEALRFLIDNYNDGRRKSFFCVAVNLLGIGEIREIMGELAVVREDLGVKDRAAVAVGLLQGAADARGVEVRLRKKPAKGK